MKADRFLPPFWARPSLRTSGRPSSKAGRPLVSGVVMNTGFETMKGVWDHKDNVPKSRTKHNMFA